jgi:hypothetical protein
MKLRIYTVLSAFILSITFPLFCNCAREETKNEDLQAVRQIKEKFVLGPGVVEEELNLDGLEAEINSNFGNMSENFKNNEFDKMVTKKASLRIPGEGIIIHKKEKRKEYWERKKIQDKYTSVKFTFVKAYIFREEMSDIEEYNAIAYVVFTFKLKKEKEGKLIQNQDGDGEESYRHTQGCDWRGR